MQTPEKVLFNHVCPMFSKEQSSQSSLTTNASQDSLLPCPPTEISSNLLSQAALSSQPGNTRDWRVGEGVHFSPSGCFPLE